MDCKCCGNWFGSASDSEICSTCERAIQRVGKYLSIINPIRAAGGCRCGECKKYMTSECLLCSFDADGSCTGGPNSDFFCGNSELIGGEGDEIT